MGAYVPFVESCLFSQMVTSSILADCSRLLLSIRKMLTILLRLSYWYAALQLLQLHVLANLRFAG